MRTKLSLFFLLAIIITIGLINQARAQDTVLTKTYHGRLDSINSDILKQKRLIQVFVPPDYKPEGSTKYDVLYVLDGGNWNTGMILQLQNFLEGEPYVPPTIIVSILNIDRIKDFTPTYVDDWKTSGGADKFLGFIKDELIPYVNKTYPSNGDNTLWGHSLGGLFVMYAMLNEPKTFKSYIAADPSLWWDKVYLPKIAVSKLPALAGLNTTLFMGGRDSEDGRSMKIDTMDAVLKKAAPAGFTWKTVMYPDESHSSVRLKLTHDGLKFIYKGFNRNIEFHPMNGIILKDKPIKIRYFNDTTNVYYTLDGTEPTTSSTKMRSEIMLTGAARVTNKYFASRTHYDKVTTGDFIIGKILRPGSKQNDLKPGGFDYAYYEGKWDSLPDFKKLTPVQTGSTKTLDINKLPRQDNFALLISGQLETKEDGYYFFLLDADPGSKLYLGNKLLIQSDSVHTQRKSFMLPLAKGFYPFRFEYIHKQDDRKLFLRYMTPAIMDTKKPVMIPFERQYGHN